MADMQHAIEIEASPEQVFQAIATEGGLGGWWTALERNAAQLGAVARPALGKVTPGGERWRRRSASR